MASVLTDYQKVCRPAAIFYSGCNYIKSPFLVVCGSQTTKKLLIFALLLSFVTTPMIVNGQSYHWGNVTIGGGGFVTGIIISKTEPNLVYARRGDKEVLSSKILIN